MAKGEVSVGWIPADFALPVSLMVRAGIWLFAFTYFVPTLIGSQDGLLARSGLLALGACALASTPLLASAFVGFSLIFRRSLRVGEYVDMSGLCGRIVSITAFEVCLHDDDDCQVRVPHLRTLLHRTKVIGLAPLVATEIVVSPSVSQAATRALLMQTASTFGSHARAQLVRVDAHGAHFRVSVRADQRDVGSKLLCALADALGNANTPLGTTTLSSEPALG